MDGKASIKSVQNALKLINEIEEKDKENGLVLLRQALIVKDEQLVTLGYDQLIFKELVKFAQFETGQLLKESLRILADFFFNDRAFHDELAETLIYRFARTTEHVTCRLCLESISKLLDHFDESIAKHSKQLLKLADLNDLTDLNPLIKEILMKLKSKIPARKTIQQT